MDAQQDRTDLRASSAAVGGRALGWLVAGLIACVLVLHRALAVFVELAFVESLAVSVGVFTAGFAGLRLFESRRSVEGAVRGAVVATIIAIPLLVVPVMVAAARA